MRHWNLGRPDRQGELLVSGGKRAPPHGPELHARPRFRADQLHEATRHDVAPGTHPVVRPDQQHRSRIQHPLEPGAPRPRLLLPDGDHGRTGGPGPGPLDVRKRAELLDGPDGEDWGELLRAGRLDEVVGAASKPHFRSESAQSDRHGIHGSSVRSTPDEELPCGLVLLRLGDHPAGPHREHPPRPPEWNREPLPHRNARERAPWAAPDSELQSAPDNRGLRRPASAHRGPDVEGDPPCDIGHSGRDSRLPVHDDHDARRHVGGLDRQPRRHDPHVPRGHCPGDQTRRRQRDRAHGGTDVSQAIDLAAALELIHSATLIHDDINDGGEMRRGRLTAYKKFGLQNALITGDFLFVKAFGIGGKFDAEIVELTADACAALAEGEIRQKRHAFDTNVSHQEYVDIITRKTALPIMAGAENNGVIAGARLQENQGVGGDGPTAPRLSPRGGGGGGARPPRPRLSWGWAGPPPVPPRLGMPRVVASGSSSWTSGRRSASRFSAASMSPTTRRSARSSRPSLNSRISWRSRITSGKSTPP